MAKLPALMLALFLFPLCAPAQKKSKVIIDCLEGNCKDGTGLVKVYCSSGLNNYINSCQQDGSVYYYGQFKNGKPTGKGRLVWTLPNYVRAYAPPSVEEIKSSTLMALLEKDVAFVFDGQFVGGLPDGEGAMGTSKFTAPGNEFTLTGLPNWHISLPSGYGPDVPVYKGTREIFYGNITLSDNSLTRKWKQKNTPTINDYFKTRIEYYEFKRMDSVVHNNGQIWAKLSANPAGQSGKTASAISKTMHPQNERYLYEERDIRINGQFIKPRYGPSVKYYLNGYSKNGWIIQDKVTNNRFVDSTYLYRILYRNGEQITAGDMPFPLDEQNWKQLQLPDGKQYEGAVNDQNLPHGYGETSFQVNGVQHYFQGYFVNGRQIGSGMLLSQGAFRLVPKVGYFEEFQLKRGYVEIGQSATSYYVGPYSDSSQVVYGRLVYGNQREFKGQIQVPALIPHGNGVYSYSNGLKKEGYFLGEQLLTGVTSKNVSQLLLHEVVKYQQVTTFVAKITASDVFLANGKVISKKSDQVVELDTRYPYYQFTCSCQTCGGDGKVVETRYAPPKDKVTTYYEASNHMAGMYEYVGTQKEVLYGTGGKYTVGSTCQACNGVGTWICKTEIR